MILSTGPSLLFDHLTEVGQITKWQINAKQNDKVVFCNYMASRRLDSTQLTFQSASSFARANKSNFYIC